MRPPPMTRSGSPTSPAAGGGGRLHRLQVDGGPADAAARGPQADPDRRGGRCRDAGSGRRPDRHHGRLPRPTLAGDGPAVREGRSSRTASTSSRSPAGPRASTDWPRIAARGPNADRHGRTDHPSGGVPRPASPPGRARSASSTSPTAAASSEARRIAALAEAHRISPRPAQPAGPGQHRRLARVRVLAQPSYIICETVHNDVPWRQDVVRRGFRVEAEGRHRPTQYRRPGLRDHDQ